MNHHSIPNVSRYELLKIRLIRPKKLTIFPSPMLVLMLPPSPDCFTLVWRLPVSSSRKPVFFGFHFLLLKQNLSKYHNVTGTMTARPPKTQVTTAMMVSLRAWSPPESSLVPWAPAVAWLLLLAASAVDVEAPVPMDVVIDNAVETGSCEEMVSLAAAVDAGALFEVAEYTVGADSCEMKDSLAGALDVEAAVSVFDVADDVVEVDPCEERESLADVVDVEVSVPAASMAVEIVEADPCEDVDPFAGKAYKQSYTATDSMTSPSSFVAHVSFKMKCREAHWHPCSPNQYAIRLVISERPTGNAWVAVLTLAVVTTLTDRYPNHILR